MVKNHSQTPSMAQAQVPQPALAAAAEGEGNSKVSLRQDRKEAVSLWPGLSPPNHCLTCSQRLLLLQLIMTLQVQQLVACRI